MGQQKIPTKYLNVRLMNGKIILLLTNSIKFY